MGSGRRGSWGLLASGFVLFRRWGSRDRVWANSKVLNRVGKNCGLEARVSVQNPALSMGLSGTSVGAWRSRTLAIVLMVAIGTIFWVDSRYPALMKRYHAGTKVKAAGALTFGAVYQLDRTMPLGVRVWRTTVKPAALTFLAMVPRRRTNSKYLNTMIGAVAGAPMAVCTNCVAPIARGFYAAGMSRESVLAAMFASPALNVVVLAMTFALFPAKVAILKLATVLFLILVFAPLAASREEEKRYICPIEIPVAESWGQAFLTVARAYGKSFWYVFRVAFPLMILGAVLGALVIELLPQQALVAQVTIGGIVLVALVGAFLPVPMAFDVAIAYIAMSHGAPMPYVVAILCTLGIISVFSLSVLGKTISWRLAAATYATVAALGIVAGVVARSW